MVCPSRCGFGEPRRAFLPGGATRAQQCVAAGARISAIATIDRNTAGSAGSRGTILHKVDGGASWVRQPSGTSADLRVVAVVDGQTVGIAGNGVVRKSATGGN